MLQRRRFAGMRIAGLMAAAALLVAGCGSQTGSEQGKGYTDSANAGAEESYFTWYENLITGFTEEGARQTELVIPSRCEGFDGARIEDTEVQVISFEDDDAVNINGAFGSSKTLTTIMLPANQTRIPGHTFQGCKALENIDIPGEVTALETYTFSGCDALKEVRMEGEKLQSIGSNCFNGCISLETVEFPEGLSSIEEYAFFGCTSLQSITFSESVKEIGFSAFVNTGIQEVHFPEGMEPDAINEGAFGTSAWEATAYIVRDSWMDQHKDILENLSFKEIAYEDQAE